MSLRTNSLLNALSTGLNAAFPMAMMAWASRHLSVQDIGRFYFANGVVSYFLMIAAGSFSFYAFRAIAASRSESDYGGKLSGQLSGLNLIFTGVSSLIYIAVIFIVPAFKAHLPIFLTLGFILFLNAFYVDFLFLGRSNFVNLFLRTLISRTIPVILTLIFVRTNQHFFLFCLLYVSSVFLHNLSGLFSERRALRVSLTWSDISPHFKACLPMLIFLLLGGVYANLDSVLLGLLSDTTQVGYYSLGTRLNRTMVALIAAIGGSLTPGLIALHSQARIQETRFLLDKVFTWLMTLSFPAMACMVVASPVFIQLVFSKNMAPAGFVCQLSAPGILVSGMTVFIGMQVLFPMGKERALIVSTAVAAFLCPVLSWILIPHWGFRGSILSWLLSETISLVILWRIASKASLLPAGMFTKMIRPALGAVLSGLAYWAVLQLPLGDLARLVLGFGAAALVYILAMYRSAPWRDLRRGG